MVGFSPGALTSDVIMRLFTCVNARTVAATNHGRPIIEHTRMRMATMKRSRWYPGGFWVKVKNKERYVLYLLIQEQRKGSAIPCLQTDYVM